MATPTVVSLQECSAAMATLTLYPLTGEQIDLILHPLVKSLHYRELSSSPKFISTSRSYSRTVCLDAFFPSLVLSL
jgi:hypothetical protein